MSSASRPDGERVGCPGARQSALWRKPQCLIELSRLCGLYPGSQGQVPPCRRSSRYHYLSGSFAEGSPASDDQTNDSNTSQWLDRGRSSAANLQNVPGPAHSGKAAFYSLGLPPHATNEISMLKHAIKPSMARQDHFSRWPPTKAGCTGPCHGIAQTALSCA